ncbi:hypothetical protein KRX57_07210 [Weeksellaceae bacterium TAE3-ERU29]|nr:hypothetical protein [Weeksellaceae bacterium TAE3-ERU29]
MYYYGARYYDSKVSLWLGTDPLSGYNPIFEHEHYIDGQHNGGIYNPMNMATYSYTYQNPVIFVDPNGKQNFFQDFWNGMKGIYMLANGEGKIVSKFENQPPINVVSNGNGTFTVQNNRASFFGIPYQSTSVAENASQIGSEIGRLEALDVGSLAFEYGIGIDGGAVIGNSVKSARREFKGIVPRRIDRFSKFSLDNPNSFEGGNPELIKEFFIKEGWDIKPAIKGKPGFRAYNPNNEFDVVHVIQGNADKIKKNSNIMKVKQGDYLKRPAEGWDRVALEGNSSLK